jgi:hypothetical protein
MIFQGSSKCYCPKYGPSRDTAQAINADFMGSTTISGAAADRETLIPPRRLPAKGGNAQWRTAIHTRFFRGRIDKSDKLNARLRQMPGFKSGSTSRSATWCSTWSAEIVDILRNTRGTTSPVPYGRCSLFFAGFADLADFPRGLYAHEDEKYSSVLLKVFLGGPLGRAKTDPPNPQTPHPRRRVMA